MKKIILVLLVALLVSAFQRIPVWGDEFKKRDAILAQYKKWLDTLGPEGSRGSIFPRGLSQPGTFCRYLFQLSRRPSGKVHVD